MSAKHSAWSVSYLRFTLAFLFIATLSIVFTAVSVDTSRSVGKLSTVPNYDDVVYLNKSAELYWDSVGSGVGEPLMQILTQNTHAPLWVAQGFVMYVLFGTDASRVYYSLALVVCFYLLSIGYIVRNLPCILWIALVTSSLAIPFASFAAFEYRPDLLWATLVGVFGVTWISSTNPFKKTVYSLSYGAGIGLLLLVKPSAFPMTICCMVGCWLLAALRGWFASQVSFSRLMQSAIFVVSSALAVCGWFWLRHYDEIFWYFASNVYGCSKDVWTFRGDILERFAYFWHGVPVACNTGWFWWPLLLIYIAGSCRDLACASTAFLRMRGGCFLWMFVCLGLVHSAFETKTVFVGGALYAFVIFGAFFYLSVALSRLVEGPLRSLPAQALAAVVLSAVAWTAHSLPPYSLANPEIAANRNVANLSALEDLQKFATSGDRVLVVVPEPVNPEFLQMELMKRGKVIDSVYGASTNPWLSGAMCRSFDELKGRLSMSDFIFLQDEGVVGEPGAAFPAKSLQKQGKDFLDSSPDWQLANTYRLTRGKNVYFYRRTENCPVGMVVPQAL